MEEINISIKLAVDCETLYNDWLSSDVHSAFTGGEAVIDATIGGTYSAWDDYITGTTTALIPYTKIVQQWRTTEFDDKAKDSILELSFKKISDNETEFIIFHHTLQAGDAKKYKEGWHEHYLEPMKEYYG